MTDVHCHLSSGDSRVREFLIGRDFFGVHPWDACAAFSLERLRQDLAEHPHAGVGEIGLDRLRERAISQKMRDVFEAQLSLAFENQRPVVLHGAKCWGEVTKVLHAHLSAHRAAPLSFLFHGFSRSAGLIPEIVRLNGYFSVGPAVLNDHAVNYRELVKKIPSDRLLLETDRTAENAAACPALQDILAKTAELRGLSSSALEALTDANARAFFPEAPDRTEDETGR